MDITAYRFELIPVEEFERSGTWETARVVDFKTEEGKSKGLDVTFVTSRR